MPKIIGGSLSEHREQTRNKLFAALATLMSERGFDSVTLAEVAAAAGVGRTAVYNHVPDKESLLLEFITHETDQWVAALERALDGLDDPVLQLRTYIRQQAELKRVFHLAPGGSELRTLLSPDMQRRLREHAVPVEAILRGILTAGMESGVFAQQPLETTVPLVHACLSSRSVPEEDGPGRSAAIGATETFVLRAVGADVTTTTATLPVAAPVPEGATG
ncbi:TetR/AcrR family transcriptional regulator [Actinotalea sp. Marseille-Q4924]|uniref:TetR/AcrR family transcriptional regulator n=1 Tax=Actinotalea sp. Marseille-Q4924 TaxID=2866571 RepID=UPI001CE3B81D|nr:TetR/AcrR family transcriptional regulator [Actinotalea sp. Marseille-Q4924]